MPRFQFTPWGQSLGPDVTSSEKVLYLSRTPIILRLQHMSFTALVTSCEVTVIYSPLYHPLEHKRITILFYLTPVYLALILC